MRFRTVSLLGDLCACCAFPSELFTIVEAHAEIFGKRRWCRILNQDFLCTAKLRLSASCKQNKNKSLKLWQIGIGISSSPPFLSSLPCPKVDFLAVDLS
jgi:hypothetical protein